MIKNLDRFLALGASCPDCGWKGTVGELRSKGTEPATGNFHCPKCSKQNVVWPMTTHDGNDTKN